MRKQNSVAFFNILSMVLLNGLAIFTGPLFTRLLGDSGYGMLKIYYIWVGAISIIFTIQTHGTIVNARVEYPEEKQAGYQSSVMTMSLLCFAAGSLLMGIFWKPLAALLGLENRMLIPLLLQAFGNFAVNFLNTKFVYEFKAGRNLVISLAVTLTNLCLSLALIFGLPQVDRYFSRILGVAATYAVIGIPACIYVLAKGRVAFNRDYWRFCLVLAVPSIFYSLSDMILGQCDQIMLQHMVSVAEVGRYASAWTFGNVMYVIFNALSRTWAPFFFDEFKRGELDSVRSKTKNFLELFTVLSMGFILLTREVYHVYVDDRFWSATPVIPVFVAGYYLNFLCSFPVNYEYYRKQNKVVAAVTVAASILNIALNYFLIKVLGMMGAALATAASHGLQLLLHHLYTRYRLGKDSYPFRLELWGKYAAAFFAMLVLAYFLDGAPLVRWGLGGAIGLWEVWRVRKRKVLI